jgi:TPR repeat protein
MLLEGDMIETDLEEARCWALAAAENGVAAAMTRLGMLYHGAIGVERDPETAAVWWQRAAELGDANAQAMLGAAHHLGSGVPVDQRAALVWLLRAEAGGSTLAERFLGPVRAALSPEEIAEAEQRARPTFQSAPS